MPKYLLVRSVAEASRASPAVARAQRDSQSPRASGEGGFLLIEVIMSAFLAAVIVVLTFNGFDAVTQATSDQRNHSDAQLLAAQSQESLRTDSATTLDVLESHPHSYTKTVSDTVFTVTQEAQPINAKGTSTGCSGTTTSKENGANIEIISSVTWPALQALKRPAVRQTSIITPPTGSALEVDVTNGATTPTPGVTSVVKFAPAGGAAEQTVEGTTGSTGCVVFTGLTSTSAKVEILPKTGFVTTIGAPQYPTQEVSIAPNVTTQDPVTYAEGARITAQFTYKGATESGGIPVKSDTFVVANTSIPAGHPTWAEGSTEYEYETTGEQKYKALTGKYLSTATTAVATKYPSGDLFPFQQPWSVYAGDCPANKVSTEAEATGGATLSAGNVTEVKVPLSHTELVMYSGKSESSKGSPVTERLGPVKITDTSCSSSETPLNASGFVYLHEQAETSAAGHLEYPFQPFGKASLCLTDKKNKQRYKYSYENKNATGETVKIYLGQTTTEHTNNVTVESGEC